MIFPPQLPRPQLGLNVNVQQLFAMPLEGALSPSLQIDTPLGHSANSVADSPAQFQCPLMHLPRSAMPVDSRRLIPPVMQLMPALLRIRGRIAEFRFSPHSFSPAAGYQSSAFLVGSPSIQGGKLIRFSVVAMYTTPLGSWHPRVDTPHLPDTEFLCKYVHCSPGSLPPGLTE
ncbi:hypothetical protein MVEN_02309500 [Mycena venus]|uniref:Uncharacterized protein n=1 Tax=Mycena venus TaxID=2733690 RepID=A0A8H6X4L6_9AGAR|nr:hypothetical protein MVEN_02309500 [Mycena venus]